MRIRSIKPEYWRSDDIAALPISTRLTFIGLWSYVDDNGVGADKLVSIVADLYADDFSRDPLETVQRVTEDLQRLTSGGQVIRYRAEHNGSIKDLLYIAKWKQHQVVNHPSKGHKYPLPTAETAVTTAGLAQPSGDPLETLTHEQGNRGTGERGKGAGEQGAGEDRGEPSEESHQSADAVAPPRKCPKHEHLIDPPDCGSCANYRRANDAWKTQQQRAEHDQLDQRRRRREAVEAAIKACDLCDEEGWWLKDKSIACKHQEAVNE